MRICRDCGAEYFASHCDCQGSKTRKSPSRSSGKCAAHGCPLPGSMSSSTHPAPDSPWFCRFHFSEQSELWPAITAWVRLIGPSQLDSRRILSYQPKLQPTPSNFE